MTHDIGQERIYLKLEESPPSFLEGRSFQIHIKDNNRILLVPIEILRPPSNHRCPVIVGGEQCAKDVGHEGKHMWGSGD